MEFGLLEPAWLISSVKFPAHNILPGGFPVHLKNSRKKRISDYPFMKVSTEGK
jgi:hypothetical protein